MPKVDLKRVVDAVVLLALAAWIVGWTFHYLTTEVVGGDAPTKEQRHDKYEREDDERGREASQEMLDSVNQGLTSATSY